MQTFDTIVVGAGVIGLTTAWRLAQGGHDVALVDPAPGRGASWAAAGMLAPVTELHYGEEALLALNIAAAARWADHAAALADSGVDVGYHRCGSVMVARDADDAAELQRLLAVQQSLGVDAEWLRSREVRRLEPNLAPSTRGGIRVDGDHQVDNRALVDGLVELCRRHPRVTVSETAVAEVRRAGDAGRVEGVRLADGRRLDAGTVVLSAGAATAGVGGITELVGEGRILPLRPVKGQLLHLRAPDGPLARRNLRGEDCYIVNRPDGRIVVGATMEEQGYDARPTAGAVRDLLHAAWELLPGIAEATFVEVAVGFRPASPDNGPLLGPVPGVDGLLLAAGHHRNGVLQSPLTADAVAAWVDGHAVPETVTAFAVDRRRGAPAPGTARPDAGGRDPRQREEPAA